MQVKTINLVMREKLQLGEYESIELGLDLTADLDPDEVASQGYQELHKEITKLFRQEAIMRLKAVIARRRDTGKPAEMVQAYLDHFAR